MARMRFFDRTFDDLIAQTHDFKQDNFYLMLISYKPADNTKTIYDKLPRQRIRGFHHKSIQEIPPCKGYLSGGKPISCSLKLEHFPFSKKVRLITPHDIVFASSAKKAKLNQIAGALFYNKTNKIPIGYWLEPLFETNQMWTSVPYNKSYTVQFTNNCIFSLEEDSDIEFEFKINDSVILNKIAFGWITDEEYQIEEINFEGKIKLKRDPSWEQIDEEHLWFDPKDLTCVIKYEKFKRTN